MLACQILDILKFIHHSNIVHRDIKPDNFLMGIDNNKNKVYLIDFGYYFYTYINNVYPRIFIHAYYIINN